MFEYKKAVNIINRKKFRFYLLPLYIQQIIVKQLDVLKYITVENMDDLCFQKIFYFINRFKFTKIRIPIKQVDFRLGMPKKSFI